MDLSEALREELNNPLPGIEFQLMFAPGHRQMPNPLKDSLTDAAVSLIILNFEVNEPEMLLIRRTEYDGPHSGQISLPGGKMDGTDNSLQDTAIRETREEIGVELNKKEYLGKLSLLDIPVSSFRVHPFVFILDRNIELDPDPNEVSYLIRFKIKDLLDNTNIKTHRFSFDKYDFEAPYFSIKNEIVWGATSMILSEFAEILKRIDKK